MIISIVIVNWNSKEYLRRCIRSLGQYAGPHSLQVIVVDGGSFDGSSEMIRSEFPEAEFVQVVGNVGFGRCNNIGARRAVGDAVLLLNPDTEVLGDALDLMVEQLFENPAIGMVGPRLLNGDGTVQSGSVHVLPTPLTEALASNALRKILPASRLGGHAVRLASSSPVEVEAIGGACMLLRTELFREIGGFTPDYFMYAEDMDLCFKVRREGLSIYHIPAAQVIHYGGGSSGARPSKFAIVMLHEALYTYMRINHGAYTADRYRFAIFVTSLARLSALLVLRCFSRRRTRESMSQSIGRWFIALSWSVGRESAEYPLGWKDARVDESDFCHVPERSR